MRRVINVLFVFISIGVISESSRALSCVRYTAAEQVIVLQDRNSITGFVFDESRVPISRINVELLNDLYSVVARVQTRGSGLFLFTGLPAGQYNVKVRTSGTDFEEQTRAVSLVPFSVVRGRGVATEQVDFYLRVKRKGSSGKFASPGVVYVQEIPDSAKALYEAGLVDLSNRNEIAGLDKIKRSVEIFPDYFLALDRLGTEYVLRGHYREAFVLLTKAVEVNKRSFSSTFGLGLALFRLGQIDKSIDSFDKAIQIDNESPNGYLWRGIGLHARNDLPAALKSLLQADERAKGASSEVHWQLARVYKDQKLYAKAADELELFLKYSPDVKNFDEIKQVVAALRMKK